MVTKRDPDRTKRAILDAAVAEFSAVGPAGARIDSIAAAAGVNKRMLYHYFENKEGLFAAVLDEQLALPLDPSASLVDRHGNAAARPEWIRLLTWEALAGDGRHAGTATRTLEAARESERDPSGLDAAQLELTLVAIALFPFAFPQLTRLITGMSPSDTAFVAARSSFLQALQARIERRSDAVEAPKPRFRLTATVTESPSQ